MNGGTGKRVDEQVWMQSPDGRVVRVDGDLGRPVGVPERALRDPLIRELEPFLQGCASVLSESRGDGRSRLGYLLFALGAVDRFWSVRGLDDARFPPYATGLSQRSGIPADQAATLVAALPRLTEEAFACRALLQGGDALESWLQSRDPNVVLRLTELVAEWRRG